MSNSKWSKHDATIAELVRSGKADTPLRVVKAILPEESPLADLESFRSYVRRAWDSVCENAGIQQTTTATAQYKSKKDGSKTDILSARKEDGGIMTWEEFYVFFGLNPLDVKSYKLITHNGIPTYNVASHTLNEAEPLSFFTEEFIEEMVKKHTKVSYQKELKLPQTDFFDRLVITDTHIGMETTSDTSMYSDPWDAASIMKKLDVVMEGLARYKRGNDLYMTDLGDLMDGYNGNTARGQHGLPQNMTTPQAFDFALEFKLRLIDRAAQIYERVFLDNICNDNHGGTLSYLVNSAIEKIAAYRYTKGEVSVTNYKKFFSHFVVGDRAFVISHGKDQIFMKHGLSPKPKTEDIQKIDGYIKANNLYKYKHVTFDKGDSHQCILDLSTSDDFFYLSYPSFAPQSEWVQTNYKKGRSGFVIQNFDIKSGAISFTPIFF